MPVASEQVHATIRRLEDWGMLARGFWIKGVAAMQLSTPDLVERLRQPYLANSAETVVLSAVDPANPYGAMLPWPDRAEAAFARKPGNFLVFRRGRWVMWIENNGKRFAVMERKSKLGEAEEEQLVTEAIRVMMRQSGLRKIVVTSWNGAAAAQSPAAGLFQRIGAETDRGSFVLWPSSLRNL
jgi:ATP-dependent Lhr-like helicase